MPILASTQANSPDLRTANGLISNNAKSFSVKALYAPVINLANSLICLSFRPSLKATSRAWQGCKPTSGSTSTFKIFSGVSSATFSISTPPSVDAMNTTRRAERSTTAPKYNSVAIGYMSSAISTLLTGCPLASVW